MQESDTVVRRAASAKTPSQEAGERVAEAEVQAGEVARAVGRERGEAGLTLHRHSAPPSSPEEKAEGKQEEEEKKELRAALNASEALRKQAEARAVQAEAARKEVEAKAEARAVEERSMVERTVEHLVREGLVDKAVASALAQKMGMARAEAAAEAAEGGSSGSTTTAKPEAVTKQPTEEVFRAEDGPLVHVALPPGFPPAMPSLRRLSLSAGSGGAAACVPSASPDAMQHGYRQ